MMHTLQDVSTAAAVEGRRLLKDNRSTCTKRHPQRPSSPCSGDCLENVDSNLQQPHTVERITRLRRMLLWL